MARIDLDGIAHAYRPNPAAPADWALKEMNFTLRQGGAYALLGPSGCGKTTLLNIISGLVRPSQGALRFDGKDVVGLPTEARNIAQVFQFPVVYDTMTVAENLAFPLKNRGMARDAVERRVTEIARLLDLDRDLTRKARGLTADAKQKISLGRGLVRPDVAAILFDEPLTVIDPHLKWELRSKLKALHRALDVTMIYVTHDQTEALTFADTVVVMHDGRIVQAGRPDELADRPDHVFVGTFIGSPGMNVVPVEVEGARARVSGSDAVIDLAKAYPKLPTAQKIELGIRPEFVALAEQAPGLPVRFERLHDLGRITYGKVMLGGHGIYGVAPHGTTATGYSHARLDAAQIHIYADGVRVEGVQ